MLVFIDESGDSGLKIEKGKHEIVFKYRPRVFYIGLLITILTLFISFFFITKKGSRIQGPEAR